MKKLWLSALTAATLVAGMSVGNAAWAGGRHGWHDHHHDRYERCDDRRYYGPPRGWGYARPYRPVREVYYVPAPRYYPAPAPVYYGGRGYRSGVSGSITVDF